MDQHLAFLQSQAAHIEAEVYQIKYASIQYPDLVPVDTSAPPFSGQITYYSEDGTGEADFLANRGTDFPTVDLVRTQHNVAIENLGISYQYDMFELGHAQRLGMNLTADKARVARRVAEEKIDQITMMGHAPAGWDGLVNNSNVSAVAAPLSGAAGTDDDNDAGNGRLWANKTAHEILKDVQEALADVWSTTSSIELADTVLLSPSRFSVLANTPLGDEANKSIADYLMQYNSYTMQTG